MPTKKQEIPPNLTTVFAIIDNTQQSTEGGHSRSHNQTNAECSTRPARSPLDVGHVVAYVYAA